MELLSMLRTLGGLGIVLGMLAAALWAVKRYDIRLPGRITTGGNRRRVELVERLSIDAKRSVALIRRDGAEHLVLIGPEGHAMLETGIAAPPAPVAEEKAEDDQPSIRADMAALHGAFGKLVEKAVKTVAEPTPEPTPPAAPTTTIEPVAAAPAKRKRTRAKPDTRRWNRAAVREAINA